MQVETTRAGGIRAVSLSPTRFRRIATLSLLALFVIVSTGAAVRLTGSGLGCESWPGCQSGQLLPEKDYHAYVEFGNRLVGGVTILLTLLAAVAALVTTGLVRWARRLAVGVFLGTLAQAPLGALTVELHLHPVSVMFHLLLSIVVLGGGVVLVLEARGLEEGHAAPSAPRELRLAGVVLTAACFVLVVSGTFATAAGPHSGGEDVRRFGDATASVYAHAAVVALFSVAFVFVLGYLAAHRSRWPRLFLLAVALLALLGVQAAVGGIQYHAELPWWLVLGHVALAASVWVATVALAVQLWRPLASFARPAGA